MRSTRAAKVIGFKTAPSHLVLLQFLRDVCCLQAGASWSYWGYTEAADAKSENPNKFALAVSLGIFEQTAASAVGGSALT